MAKNPISRQASSIRAGHGQTLGAPTLTRRGQVDQRDFRPGRSDRVGSEPGLERREHRAAVDDERLAGHERAVVGGEEKHGALHIVGKGLAPEGARLHDGRHLEGP